MKSLAAILVELNAPLEVAEIEIPKLDVGQVLVEVHASGICGAQLGEIAGVKGPDRYLPHLLGHEGSGVVLEIGPGVSFVKPGDHVVMHWVKGAGIQAGPPKYSWDGKLVNAGWVTTFNQYAVVSENRLTPIAEDIPFEIASLFGCAVTTGFGIVNKVASVRIGESVAVLGVGGVGQMVVRASVMVSAHPIIAIDLHDHKLEMALQLGATHAINTSQSNAGEELARIVGVPDTQVVRGKPSDRKVSNIGHQHGVDVFVENTGNVSMIELAYSMTRARVGRTVLVGVPSYDEDISIHTLPLHFGQVLTGVEGGDTVPGEDIPRYLDLYRQGKLDLDNAVTHRYPLSEINTAIEKMRHGEVGRCVLSTN